ncbi:MAG: DUF1801 domain-containing protein [Thalassotalea sp.]
MDLAVKQKFESYPQTAVSQLYVIRELIYKVAEQCEIDDLTETLKWGEPSYITKCGSTIRFDWKAKAPAQYCLYFNCRTTLVATFKEVYGDIFTYDGNRAIIFTLGADVPMPALAHCISMALCYKKIKHLELLGA